MHDLDRTMLEAAMDGEAGTGPGTLGAEREEFLEVLGELVGEGDHEAGGPPAVAPRGEVAETESALELLGVSTEQELDRFVGDLVTRAAGAVRDFARTPTGQALTGIATSAIGQALPVVGRAVGERIRPGYGEWGARAGRAAGDLLGLELEGLSQEDREFETAQALVRWTADAARRAAAMPPQAPPARAARAAAVGAAQRVAPGLAQVVGRLPVPPPDRPRQREDRTVTSSEYEYGYEVPAGEWEAEQDEQELFGELVTGETGGVLTAAQEMELAGQLLQVGSEAELEEFLGDIVRKVTTGARGFMRSGAGKALVGGLKNVAKAALPIVGGVVGSAVPVVGTALGTTLGTMASNLFELELESMNEEEAEFAVAQEIVGMTSRAARNAASAPRGAPPRAVARAAIIAATPGLRRSSGRRRPRPPSRPGRPRPRPGAAYPVPYPTPWGGGSGGDARGDGAYGGGAYGGDAYGGDGYGSDDGYAPDDGGPDDTDGSASEWARPGGPDAGRWERHGRTIVLRGV